MDRPKFLENIIFNLNIHPVSVLLGPRQCGKTTLAQHYVAQYRQQYDAVHHFDLENPEDLLALSHPYRALERLKGLIIIDEIQRVPEIFPILRVLADRQQAKYLYWEVHQEI